ncbi:uncharacterized protein BDZ99DRAFT_523114 [Mytilinidion resinicola]|uniref:Uncharacterized protein n=1 Tax=Mytilinidion resinicola TaxID=574789 RepID=A0A6A6YFI6_9PEZI|nr:uncharacterized protein BDZ99DRAFT_523114 [Mytilinidion resinicola]KAF2807500.1 hypothetical protein BDZ99DRAFT_523114 [Mytilinidion resinicola]
MSPLRHKPSTVDPNLNTEEDLTKLCEKAAVEASALRQREMFRRALKAEGDMEELCEEAAEEASALFEQPAEPPVQCPKPRMNYSKHEAQARHTINVFGWAMRKFPYTTHICRKWDAGGSRFHKAEVQHTFQSFPESGGAGFAQRPELQTGGNVVTRARTRERPGVEARREHPGVEAHREHPGVEARREHPEAHEGVAWI